MEITRGFAESVIAAVKSCKAIMMDSFTVSEKDGASNLVTTADTSVQANLKEHLAQILPQAGFLGEEAPAEAALGAGSVQGVEIAKSAYYPAALFLVAEIRNRSRSNPNFRQGGSSHTSATARRLPLPVKWCRSERSSYRRRRQRRLRTG